MNNIRHWTAFHTHVDISPYAGFYKKYLSYSVSPKLVVDLGVRDGCSSRILLEDLTEKDTLILVDPVKSEGAAELEQLCANVGFKQSLAEECVGDFEDNSISLLHIDVDPHEAIQTKTIFDLYSKKVKVGGVVIFHDCAPGVGVHKFVTEDLSTYIDWEILEYCEPDLVMGHTVPAAAIRKN